MAKVERVETGYALQWIGGPEGTFISPRFVNSVVAAGREIAIAHLGDRCRQLEAQLKEREMSNG